MGEVLAFRPPTGGMRATAAPAEAGLILFFTGVRREPISDAARPSKRPRRVADKRAAKPRGRSAIDRVNDAKVR